MELCACVTRTLCAVVLNEHLALNCHNYHYLCSHMKLEQLSRHILVNELLRKRLCKWRNFKRSKKHFKEENRYSGKNQHVKKRLFFNICLTCQLELKSDV